MKDGCVFNIPTVTNFTTNQRLDCKDVAIMGGGMQQSLIYAFEQIKVIIGDKVLNSKGPENLLRGLQLFSSAKYQEFEETLAVINVQILALIDRFNFLTLEFYSYHA